MANYVALTSWQIKQSLSRPWLAVAVRLVADTDTSTTSSYHVFAEVSAYQFPGANENLGVYYYKNGTVWPPAQRMDFTNGTGLLGTVKREDLGNVAAGSSITSPSYHTGVSLSGGWVYSQDATASYTVPVAPDAPTAISNTRVSDNQQNVAWTVPATTYTRVRLKRYTDGSTQSGSWALSGNSYTDTSTAAGYSYTYGAALELVPPLGEAFMLSSAEITSSATYNSPLAPTAISGARVAANTVRLTLSNTVSTSTGLEVQASTDPADWSAALTSTYAGAGLQTVDVSGIAGTYYFRARNTRGALVSDWSPISDGIVTLTPPAAPTLTAPASGGVIAKSAATVTFKWIHNPQDGSAQTAAEVAYSTDGGSTWTTANATTAQEKEISNGFSVNDTVTWRVRTKGADPSFGSWSATRQFYVYQAPTVTITLEDENGNNVAGGTLSDMPLVYALSVSDASGSTAAATVEVGGYSEAVDTGTLAGRIEAAEFLPDNDSTYTFTASVQSSSSLAASASVTFSTAFVLPQAGTLSVTDNGGLESLTIGLAPQQPGETAADSISVYRVANGQQVLLASDLQDGATVTDYFAPLNVDYSYLVVTYSGAGIAQKVSFPARIRSSKFFAIWNGGHSTASARWNPAGSIGQSRPQRTLVQYIGRQFPVAYDGTALSDKRSMSWELISSAERDEWLQLMADGGQAVYKSGDGDVFMAVFEISFQPVFTNRNRYGSLSVDIVRIESGAL